MEAKLHGKLWFDVLKILVGSSLVAVSFRYLTFPNSIVSGGVTGIAQIVNLLTGLPVGIVTVAINAPLFIWAWKQLGKRFVGLTLLCMLTSSLLIDLLAHFPYTVTEEPMLAAVYGGLVSGAGYGLCYTSGATAGGTDISSRMLRRRYPHINMTTFILFFNLVIIVTFAFVFHRFDSCMYTLICMYITNKIESLILYGPINSRLCYIISDKSADLSSAITGRLHRGVTLLDGHGAWSGKTERVIMCAVKPGQLGPLRRMVREIDPKSFLIVGDARTIYGHGFESIEED